MKGLAGAWQRFWFEPQSTSTLALVRMAFGVVVLAWTVSLTHDAFDFFTPTGVLPGSSFEGETSAAWSVLDLSTGRTAVAAVLVALLGASLCLIVGQWTRAAAIVVFVALVSLERRNPFVFNSGDGLLKVSAFYLALAPAGASLSLDRWRRSRRDFWTFPARAPWALRLMQVQLSVIYLSGLWAKLRGAPWNDGTAVSYALRLEDIARLRIPSAAATSELASNVLTYGTLAAEATIGVLVWNRKLRPWVLALGVGLHVGIDLTLRVGFFSYAVFVLYLAFAPPKAVDAKVLELRARLAGRAGQAHLADDTA
jgi:Vitamin K-dependent gamma-carboxylase